MAGVMKKGGLHAF